MTSSRKPAAVVTGGSRGIGLAIAEALVGVGYATVVLDKHRDPAFDASPAMVQGGTFVEVDLGDTDRSAQVAREIAESTSVQIFVGNAAVYPREPLSTMAITLHEEVQRVNVSGQLACLQPFIPGMKQRALGRIAFVSSITAFTGNVELGSYAASKAALIGLSHSLARELGPHGITVNCVAPGAIPTAAEDPGPDPAATAALILDRQVIKRRGAVSDIAEAVLFLTHGQSGFVSGQTLIVDGGWVMS